MASSRPVLLDELTPEVLAEVSPTRGRWRRSSGSAAAGADRADGGPPPHARGDRPDAVRTGPPFTQDDVDLAADLGSRAALAIDNVRLYQREHTVADTLQRRCCRSCPRSRASSRPPTTSAPPAADVGGDFYDLLALPDDSVAIVVGDVVGHDVAAAAAMGHLRGLLRACVWDAEDADPGAVLARVDRLVQGLRVASLATMVYARAVRPDGDGEPVAGARGQRRAPADAAAPPRRERPDPRRR